MNTLIPQPSRDVHGLSLVGHDGLPEPSPHLLRRGHVLFEAGSYTTPCRIVSGAVRMDPSGAHRDAVLLALPGDLLGLDALLGQTQSCSARTLVSTVIEPLAPMPDLAWRGLLVRSLIAQQARSAELGRLRAGSAAERVRFLLQLLAGHITLNGAPPLATSSTPPSCELPTLADMAAVTDSAAETVSRVISSMRRSGMLKPDLGRRVHLGQALLDDADVFPLGMTRSRVHSPLARSAH